MAERKKAKGIWTAQSPDEDARQLDEVRVVDENGFNPSERPIGEAETEDPGVIDNRPTTPRQPAMKRVYADMPEVKVSAQNPSGAPAMPDATAQEPNAYQKMMIDHGNELADYEKAYDGQIKSVGDFISAAEAKIKERKEQDGQYRKRENAYRYISGLGDTLSGIANLVGTANDASNQEQKYNSHAVVQKAEEARKARKLEMDKISERIDEMKERERALRASKDLKTAELRARQAKEARELQFRQDQLAREQERLTREQEWKESEAERAQANTDRAFAENQRQFNETNKRLAEAAAAENASRKEIKKLELEAKAKAKASDPEHQAQMLRQNITGIRDELASAMGYKDYNEYLRYKNVSGWGTDIEGQRNKESKKIRDQRASENPETEEFLGLLASPEDLTEEQISMLASASAVFADALKSAGADVKENPTNGKKKVW